MDIEILCPHRCQLGECPLWHDSRQELFWFDIKGKKLFSLDPDNSNSLSSWDFDLPVSAAAIIDHERLLIAKGNALFEFSIENEKEKNERLTPRIELEETTKNTRTNDGRVAPDGSFWIGTMSKENQIQPNQGTIYRYSINRAVALIRPITIPNSIAFSRVSEDQSLRVYWADSKDRRIYFLSLILDDLRQLTSIDRSKVKLFCEITQGVPDGSVIDSEDYLWNAQWGGSKVVRYAPDGSVDTMIDLPVSQPTCPAFIGKSLKTLAITTAYDQLDCEQIKNQPLAGMTLSIPIGVAGRNEYYLNQNQS